MTYYIEVLKDSKPKTKWQKINYIFSSLAEAEAMEKSIAGVFSDWQELRVIGEMPSQQIRFNYGN